MTGTQAYEFNIPNDTDYSYLGWVLHANSSTGVVSVTNPSDGTIVYAQIDASYNLVLSSPNQPTLTASLTSLGYSIGMSHSCLVAIAKAAAVSIIAAAVAVAIILGLCVGDGPVAAFSCGFGWMLGSSVIERASVAAHNIAAEGGC